MAIDTSTQMLLRIAELRQMRDAAAERGVHGTVRQLNKMIEKAENDYRTALERGNDETGQQG